MVAKLYERYGASASNLIKENPYRLIDDVDGFGFKRCDNLALNMGIEFDDRRRINAALIYTINFICYQEGFTYITKEQLINSAKSLLNMTDDIKINNSIDELVNSKKIVYKDDKYYDSYLYKCENDVKDKLIKMSSKPIYKKDKVEEALEYYLINYLLLQVDLVQVNLQS